MSRLQDQAVFPIDPGTQWRVLDDPILEPNGPRDNHWVLCPCVVKLPHGGFRLYYTGASKQRRQRGGLGVILSAVSHDGVHWEREPGIRLNTHAPWATQWVYSAHIVATHSGWEMWYQSRSPDVPDTIGYALSKDGLSWNVQSLPRLNQPGRDLGSPRLLSLADGKTRLYYHRFHFPHELNLQRPTAILSAVAEDGDFFLPEGGERVTQTEPWESASVYASHVIKVPDGYRMYYAGWQREPRLGRIFTATSRDGLTWIKHPKPCIDVGGRWNLVKASEPFCVLLPDGPRLFFEACDSQGVWRILCAAPRSA